MSYRQHCCDRMQLELSKSCHDDAERHRCPDMLVEYSAKFDEYGIAVHDGGTSAVQIQFCPWCGTKLPASKRERWFRALEHLGIDPWSDDVPERFQSEAWFRDNESE